VRGVAAALSPAPSPLLPERTGAAAFEIPSKRSHGAGRGKIGEAEVELGMGYCFLGMPRKAQPLLEAQIREGV